MRRPFPNNEFADFANLVAVHDYLLSSQQISDLLDFLPQVDKYRLLEEHVELENYLVHNVLPHLGGAWSSSGIVSVNVGSRPVGFHLDSKINDGETHKLLVYLTDTGGTQFFTPIDFAEPLEIETPRPWLEVQSISGRCVVFDMSLPHKGTEFEGIKKTVGLRLIKHKN